MKIKTLIERYNELEYRLDLHDKLMAGLHQFDTGETIDETEMMSYMDKLIKNDPSDL
jgi:hypothetical protein